MVHAAFHVRGGVARKVGQLLEAFGDGVQHRGLVLLGVELEGQLADFPDEVLHPLAFRGFDRGVDADADEGASEAENREGRGTDAGADGEGHQGHRQRGAGGGRTLHRVFGVDTGRRELLQQLADAGLQAQHLTIGRASDFERFARHLGGFARYRQNLRSKSFDLGAQRKDHVLLILGFVAQRLDQFDDQSPVRLGRRERWNQLVQRRHRGIAVIDQGLRQRRGDFGIVLVQPGLRRRFGFVELGAETIKKGGFGHDGIKRGIQQRVAPRHQKTVVHVITAQLGEYGFGVGR